MLVIATSSLYWGVTTRGRDRSAARGHGSLVLRDEREPPLRDDHFIRWVTGRIEALLSHVAPSTPHFPLHNRLNSNIDGKKTAYINSTPRLGLKSPPVALSTSKCVS